MSYNGIYYCGAGNKDCCGYGNGISDLFIDGTGFGNGIGCGYGRWGELGDGNSDPEEGDCDD